MTEKNSTKKNANLNHIFGSKNEKIFQSRVNQKMLMILRGKTAVSDFEMISNFVSKIVIPTQIIIHKRGLKAPEIDTVGVFLPDS